MALKRINPSSLYAQVSVEDILTEDLTDPEFRLYTFYRSCTPTHTMSAKETAKKLDKDPRTITRLNKSLIQKGYLLITGNSNPTYHIGTDIVEIVREEQKQYLKNREQRYEKLSKRRTEDRHLPKKKKKVIDTS